MAIFSIEIYEFALLINRPSGLTVIFPAADHVLSLTLPDGSVAPVARGQEIVLKGPAGAEIPAAKTYNADPGALVVDLSTATGQTIVPSSKLISGAIDPTVINGRLILSGGDIVELPCSLGLEQWTFAGGTFSLTDTARFDHSINPGEVYQLFIGNQPIANLTPDSSVTFHNQDALGGAPKPFAELGEFLDLCNLVNVFNVPSPKRIPAPTKTAAPAVAEIPSRKGTSLFKPFGPNSLCFLAQVSSAV